MPPLYSAPRLPIQPKLKVGAVDDPLEHEADHVAGQVMRIPESDVPIGLAQLPNSRIQPKLRAGSTGDPLERERTIPYPDAFRGRGDPLPAPVRGFFERRLDCDFGGVRVHHGADAAKSALSLGARAYTYGQDIVFGAGEYSPGSARARGLLAHELAHVVQQRAGHGLVQRSPLSDSVKDAWTTDPTIEALLSRLSQPDVQNDQADPDLDAELARILANRPDDLWLAQKIRRGELGKTTGVLNLTVGLDAKGKRVDDKKSAVRRERKYPRKSTPQPIKVVFVRGTSDRRALVIASVHGSERQGIQVADLLIKDFTSPPKSQPASPPPQPFFTTIIVPTLFPDNAAAGPFGEREGDDIIHTNRNFPVYSKSLAAAGGDEAKDALDHKILLENRLLIELMERFRPERIISIHGTHDAGHAGISYDPRSLRPDEREAAHAAARGYVYFREPDGQGGEFGEDKHMRALEDRLWGLREARMLKEANDTDRDLSLRAAKAIDADTAGIKGREARDMTRQSDKELPPTRAEITGRKLHPSVAGNIGPTGKIDYPVWTGKGEPGVSLGGYAPPQGISVFTVEPPVDRNIADYSKKGHLDGSVGVKDREIELQSYADAVRTILLGGP